jgi:hypothetical protein
MVVTEAGIVMEAIFVYAKALISILLSVDGRLIEVSPEAKNAHSLREVTLVGSVIDVYP